MKLSSSIYVLLASISVVLAFMAQPLTFDLYFLVNSYNAADNLALNWGHTIFGVNVRRYLLLSDVLCLFGKFNLSIYALLFLHLLPVNALFHQRYQYVNQVLPTFVVIAISLTFVSTLTLSILYAFTVFATRSNWYCVGCLFHPIGFCIFLLVCLAASIKFGIRPLVLVAAFALAYLFSCAIFSPDLEQTRFKTNVNESNFYALVWYALRSKQSLFTNVLLIMFPLA